MYSLGVKLLWLAVAFGLPGVLCVTSMQDIRRGKNDILIIGPNMLG